MSYHTVRRGRVVVVVVVVEAPGTITIVDRVRFSGRNIGKKKKKRLKRTMEKEKSNYLRNRRESIPSCFAAPVVIII